MQILQVTNGFPPTATAGVEQYTYQLSRGLAARHEVRIFCREGESRRPDYEILDGEFDGLPVRRVTNDFQHARHVRDYYLDKPIEAIFRQTLAEQPPDLIHFQHCIGLSASLLDVAADSKIPYLLTLHDYWFICNQVQLLDRQGHMCPGPIAGIDCYDCRLSPDGMLGSIRGTRFYQFLRMSLSDDAKRRILSLLARLAPRFQPPPPDEALSPFHERDRYMLARLSRVPVILTPSVFVRNLYIEHGVPAERISALALGLEMSLWADTRTDDPEPGAGLRVGYLGTLLHHKGVHVLIDAFRCVPDPQASLTIYGYPVPHDPYIDTLKKLAGSDRRVRLAGRYEHRQLPAILRGVDVLVIPSLWHETFSIVAREALLSGTPVVTSRVGALPEVIRDGENGLLIPPGDVTAMGAALAGLASDPARLARLRQGAITSARDVKSMEAHVAEMEDLYRSLLER